MEQNVRYKYKRTINYTAQTSLLARCTDWHVPKAWMHKKALKVQAFDKLNHYFLKTIDTNKKYEPQRL